MVLPGRVLFFADCRRKIMENKGKKKSSSRNDISLDQAILQWIVDDYDIPDEKSRKIVGESGKKSKLITCKMVMDYLDNRGVVEETDETEFMRALRKRLYYAIDTVVGPIPMKSKSITDFSLLSSNTPTSTACSQTFIMHFFQQHPTIKSNHSSSNSSPAIFFRSSIYAHVRFNDSNASLVLANSPSNNSFHRLSTVFCFIPIAGFSINESKPSLIKFFSHSLAS